MKKKAIIIGCSLAAVILIVIGCVFVLGKSDKNNNAGEISTQAVPSIMESGSDDVKTPDTPELSLEDDKPVNGEESSETTNKPGNDQPEQTTQKPDGGEGDKPNNREEPTEAPTEVPTEEPTETPTEEPTEQPTEEPTEEPTDGDNPNELPFVPF